MRDADCWIIAMRDTGIVFLVSLGLVLMALIGVVLGSYVVDRYTNQTPCVEPACSDSASLFSNGKQVSCSPEQEAAIYWENTPPGTVLIICRCKKNKP